MNPVAFSIFGFTVAWYGILITAGILGGVMIGTRLARQRGLNEKMFGDMVFWAVVWGLIGARLVYVLTSPQSFQNASLLDYINLRQGGISIHGGLAGGLLALVYYAWRYRINLYRYAELMIPGVALGIIGGRLGNIMNGSDTVGRVTGWPIGFTWPPGARAFHDSLCNPNAKENLAQYCENVNGQLTVTAPVHFTQLYGVFIGVALLIASYFWLRSRKAGWAFWQFWLWYSLLRAGIEETFRLNPLLPRVYLDEGLNAPGIGLWTLTQVASVPIILLSMFMLYRIARQPDIPQAQQGGRHDAPRAKGA